MMLLVFGVKLLLYSWRAQAKKKVQLKLAKLHLHVPKAVDQRISAH